MTFYEKTTTLVNFRGAIKAAIVEDIPLKVDHTPSEANQFWDAVQEILTPTGATIWFMSGSYAIWDRYGKYWDFIVVPAIPEYLRPEQKIRAEKVSDTTYSIWFEKLEIGKAVQEVDGYFYFDPYGRKGLWSDYSMRWISDCIADLNHTWDEHVKRYLG